MLALILQINILDSFKQKLAFPVDNIIDKMCIFSENINRLQQNHTKSAFLEDLSYVARHSCQMVRSDYMQQKPRSERLALAIKVYNMLTSDSSDNHEEIMDLLRDEHRKMKQ